MGTDWSTGTMAKSSTTPTTTSTPAATLARTPEQGTVTTGQPQGQSQAEQVAEVARELAPLLNAVAAKQAAEDERLAAVQEQADKALLACRKAYARGDKAHCAGLLEAGRWASQYISLRLSVGSPRENAVLAVAGELAKVAWDKVDPNRLVAVYHTHRLLSAGYCEVAQVEEAPQVPYSHLRDGWRNLVLRVPGDTAEDYVLLPGMESECWGVYATAVRDKLELPTVQERARQLQGLYAKRELARKAQEQAKVAEEAKAKQAEVEEARKAALAEAKALREQERAHEEAKQRAKQDASEETARALEASAAALREQQQATIKAQEEAAQAQRESARLQKEQAELQKAQDRLAAQAVKAAEEAERKAKVAEEKAQGKGKGQAPVKDPNAATHPGVASTRELESRKRSASAQGKGVTDDPLAALAEGTAKDSAEQLVAVFECHEAPDDLLLELLQGLSTSGDMGKRAKEACKAALAILRGQDSKPQPTPSPVDLAAHLAPATNGTPAAAAK